MNGILVNDPQIIAWYYETIYYMYHEKYTNYFSRTFLNAALHIFLLLDLSSWMLLYLALLLSNSRIITLLE